ncbi:MAG TPA: hypothetical protein VFM85_03360 [Actinomycetota bacterium]|nr:hypothetical protein [Actinomycetota bacterium]
MAGTRTAEELAAPLGAVDRGHLVFARGAWHLTIRVDDSMEDLYRARFEGRAPEVRVEGGTVTVKYRPSLHPTRGEITLTGRIPWSINAHAGMSDVVANLEDLELRGWEVSAGASKIQATLPRPKDAVRIRIGAGASHVQLIRPAGVPVRVHIGGGASKLAIDEFRGSGKIDWRSPDYDQAEGRYDIEVGAGASNLTVRT